MGSSGLPWRFWIIRTFMISVLLFVAGGKLQSLVLGVEHDGTTWAAGLGLILELVALAMLVDGRTVALAYVGCAVFAAVAIAWHWTHPGRVCGCLGAWARLAGTEVAVAALIGCTACLGAMLDSGVTRRHPRNQPDRRNHPDPDRRLQRRVLP